MYNEQHDKKFVTFRSESFSADVVHNEQEFRSTVSDNFSR